MWFCTRHSEESLKVIAEHEYDVDNPSGPIIDRSAVAEKDDKGGCFGKGPGNIFLTCT